MSSKVALLKSQVIAALMKHIEPLFRDGTEITLIARVPGNNEADILITTERDMEEIKALVERSMKREVV